jgi:hypothetical protein
VPGPDPADRPVPVQQERRGRDDHAETTPERIVGVDQHRRLDRELLPPPAEVLDALPSADDREQVHGVTVAAESGRELGELVEGPIRPLLVRRREGQERHALPGMLVAEAPPVDLDAGERIHPVADPHVADLAVRGGGHAQREEQPDDRRPRPLRAPTRHRTPAPRGIRTGRCHPSPSS